MQIRSPHFRCFRKGLAFSIALLAATSTPARGDSASNDAEPSRSVRYTVRFPEYVLHQAEISVDFHGVPAGKPLQLRMSRTSPGRYALHEFAKNVYDVRAETETGDRLDIEQENPHQWNVLTPPAVVRVTYTLFADHADGTYSGIDRTHAHLNMPASFLWARGFEDAPIRIAFEPAVAEWRAATQLVPTRDPFVFTAPDLGYFMDSPVELAAFSERTWQVKRGGETVEMRLVLHHEGDETDLDAFAAKVLAVTEAQFDIFGRPPQYETGSYTVILDALPHVYPDGMEHRNSTVITGTGSIAENATSYLEAIAHEFFHQWNVERIRPRALEPFSFEQENTSGELWFAEGFTSYYAGLTLRRAGILTDSAYARSLSTTVNAISNAPGRRVRSPVEMSRHAPFVDRFAHNDRDNTRNTYLSYYTWGSGIGLALDLTMRRRFGLALDDLMRSMWDEFGRAERPYSLYDIERRLADVTNDAAFAKDFFDRFVRGTEAPDFFALLDHAGFAVRARAGDRVFLGGSFGGQPDEPDAVTLVAAPPDGSPLFAAGMDLGDRLLAINGRAVTSVGYVQAVMDMHGPGDAVRLRFRQRGVEVEADVAFVQDPSLEVIVGEDAGLDPTPQKLLFRRGWLGE